MDLDALVALSLAPGSRRRQAEAAAAADQIDGSLQAALECLAPPGGLTLQPQLVAASRRALADAARLGVSVIPLGRAEYPPLLAAIPDPPLVIWVRGDPASLSRPAVAIVGSRAAAPASLEIAARLGADLAARGLVVVSGLARGCDGAAHRGALEAGGATLAVLGSGPDVVYPPEHVRLAADVCHHGALLSELPPGTPPAAHHFPLRNRIISGLSLAVVVVEAGEKSGSLITASCALEQGRDVMAVPGAVLGGRHRGGHALLRDGARLVEAADDVLEELAGRWPLPPGGAEPPGSHEVAAEASEPGDLLLAVFRPGDDMDVDEIVALTGLPATEVLARLGALELGGGCVRLPGGRYMRRMGK